MASPKKIHQVVVDELSSIYNTTEAQSIGYRLLDDVFGIRKSQIVSDEHILEFDIDKFSKCLNKLVANTPIQYVVGSTEFHGLNFQLNPSVLIPRPETEELADRIIWEYKASPGLKILDIGTGSGCIAITLSKFLYEAEVFATDINDKALETANKNSELNGVAVNFQSHDILKSEIVWGPFDIIVSNPPYVLDSEKITMHSNVLDNEPHQALFVPDTDPLIFYKVINQKANSALKSGGKLYFEINEKYGEAVAALMRTQFADVTILKDLNGKDRMISAIKP